MSRQFLMGFATALCLVMMMQDWFGLDGYIQHLRGHWIDMPWWVCGVLAIWCIWLGRDKAPNKTN